MMLHVSISNISKTFRYRKELHIADPKLEVILVFRTVIADEAHRLKEPMSQTTLALKSIQCQMCFALTGTLVQNRIDEMWSVLDFVRQHFTPHAILLRPAN